MGLLEKDNAVLDGPPVFITGAPKSGKSVFLDVFKQLPSFYAVVEPLSTWRIGMQHREDDRRTAKDATQELAEAIRSDILRQCQSAGATRYADDMSYHALRIPFLRAIYPDARIVLVTRHPKEFLPEALYFWTLKPSIVRIAILRWKSLRWSTFPALVYRFAKNLVSSKVRGRLNTWGAVVPGQKEFGQSHSVAELAAYQWAKIHQCALDDASRDPVGVHIVSFEDLRGRPRETVAEALRYCQVPVTEEILEFAAGHFQENFYFPKRTELSPQEWDAALAVLRDTAARLGYEIES